MKLDIDYNAWAATWHLPLGPVSVNILMLAGAWISLGIHVSIVPAYIDIHFLWFIITIHSRSRGDEQYLNEQEWLRDSAL